MVARYPKAVWMGQTINVGKNPFSTSDPRFIVQHYTAGRSGEGSAKFLWDDYRTRNPPNPSSAHFVIDRDGTVRQLSEINRVAWHAGVSTWKGIVGLNSHSIGIEYANLGWLYTGRDALMTRHKAGGPVRSWEPYAEAQIAAGLELNRWLMAQFPKIEGIVGHDDISPGRKQDPGPAFPMERFQALIHGSQPRMRSFMAPISLAAFSGGSGGSGDTGGNEDYGDPDDNRDDDSGTTVPAAEVRTIQAPSPSVAARNEAEFVLPPWFQPLFRHALSGAGYALAGYGLVTVSDWDDKWVPWIMQGAGLAIPLFMAWWAAYKAKRSVKIEDVASDPNVEFVKMKDPAQAEKVPNDKVI